MPEIFVSKKVVVKNLEENLNEARNFGNVIVVSLEDFDTTVEYLEREMNDCRNELVVVGIGKFSQEVKTKILK